MKAYVEAYGCTLNFGESREIEDMLSAEGWELVEDQADADLAVLATCVVVEKTERAMMKRVRALSSVPRLVITGCMATAGSSKAAEIAPGVAFAPPGDLESVRRIAGNVGRPRAKKPRAPGSYCIVPLATGCTGRCSYCITKLARGELRSRSSERIVREVELAASSGPREIRLTAQDTAAFGSDSGTNIPELVDQLCRLPLDFRLRVGMMNPRSVLPIIDKIADMYREQKVFKFLHLPVQSASDRILSDMDRGYSAGDFRRIVKAVRKVVPEVTLSTDLIVGYPGEAEDDHRANLSLIEEQKPDIVNVTRFSARPGTKAAKADKQVVGWKAKDRSREITKVRFAVALAKDRAWLNRSVRALATENGKSHSTILRTDQYKQVVVAEELPLGRYYRVRVTGANSTYLRGSRIVSR
jgi:MiaB-like tRNA modifying enzyme